MANCGTNEFVSKIIINLINQFVFQKDSPSNIEMLSHAFEQMPENADGVNVGEGMQQNLVNL